MLGMHPHKNRHQMTTDLMKLKTYQSLLFFPAYLFSLEDLKRKWWIVTFPLKLHVEYNLFGCKGIRLIYYMMFRDFG